MSRRLRLVLALPLLAAAAGEARAAGTSGIAPVAGAAPVVPAPGTPGESLPSWRVDPVARADYLTTAKAALSGSVAVVPPPAAWQVGEVTAPAASPCDAPCVPVCPDPCRRRFEASGRWWRVQPSGTTLITRGGVPGSGTRIDLEDDLSTDDGNAFSVGLAWRFLGRHRVFAEYEWISFSGSSVLSDPVVFRGATYPAGEHVHSSLDLDTLKAGWDYAIVARPCLEVRAGVAAWWWTFEQRLEGRDSDIDQTRTFSHVLPVAHVAAEGTWRWLHGFARAEYGYLASDRSALNLEGGAGVRLWDRVSIDAGWRWMRFQFHETTNEGDYTFTGPFLGLSVDF